MLLKIGVLNVRMYNKIANSEKDSIVKLIELIKNYHNIYNTSLKENYISIKTNNKFI